MFAEFQRDKFLPFRSYYLDIDGLSLHYFDEGGADSEPSPQPRDAAKPVVFLLHGNPTWSFYYRTLIAKLRPFCRVIAPDFIGFGLSDQPADVHFRARDRVQHVERLIQHLGIEKFSLVMHDWGGPIGTSLAVRQPERIESLVYLNTTLTETESLPSFIKFAAKPIIGRFLLKNTTHFVRLVTEFGVTKALPREIKAGYYYPFLTRKARTAIWDFVADIPFGPEHPTYSELLDMAKRLPSLRHVPVLIIWGLKDPCFHRAMLHQVARHFPQAQVLEIPDASHLVLEDAPEECCNRIDSFFRERISTGTPSKNEVEEATLPGESRAPTSAPVLYARFQNCAIAHPNAHAVIVPRPHAGLFGLRSPDGPAVSYVHTSFQNLLTLVRQYERGLSDLGLRSGDRVLMFVSPGADFLALSYAVMGRGAIPIFIDPGIGLDSISQCIRDTDPHVFIGMPRAQLLRLVKGRLLQRIKFHVTVTNWSIAAGNTTGTLKRFSSAPLPAVNVEKDAPGLIAFTSGATGTPKGVIFTNAMLERQMEIFQHTFGFERGKKDLPLLPIFSLFSLPLGVCSVFPPMNPSRPLALSPDLIVKVIHDLGLHYSFGSPTLWNKISDYCIRHEVNLPSLERIYMAGAPVTEAVLAKVKDVCSHAEVCTPYGATEALPVTLGSITECGDRSGAVCAAGGEVGTPVGKAVDGLSIKVIKVASGPIRTIDEVQELPAYTIGEIIVRGEHVSPAYLNRVDANSLGKISDGASFWHRMGDVGYQDTSGRLYFCGRKAHMVSTERGIWYSDPVEFIFNQHPKVMRSALIGLYNGREAAVAIEALPEYAPHSDEDRLRFSSELRELAERFPVTAQIEKFFFHPSFPVDARHNAKIFRDRLGTWATRLEERSLGMSNTNPSPAQAA